MISKICYILKDKKQNKKELKTTNVESNAKRGNTIFLSTCTLENTILWYFELSKEQCLINDSGVSLNIKITDINSVWYGVNITINQSTRVSLMTVSASDNQKNNIRILESFDKKLCQDTPVLTNLYEIVKTYDDVSSYYCELIYPLLNDFDRKMRLLLYNTYYILFNNDFSQVFDFYTDETNHKIKRRKMKNNGTELSSDNLFYEYDYTQMMEMLFESRKIVRKNNDKSDWELYFAEKIKFSTSKEDIEKIKDLRNKVAHCKLFSRKDYEKLKSLLVKYNEALDKAIGLTYSNDFVKEYITSIKNTFESISCKLREMATMLEKRDYYDSI